MGSHYAHHIRPMPHRPPVWAYGAALPEDLRCELAWWQRFTGTVLGVLVLAAVLWAVVK